MRSLKYRLIGLCAALLAIGLVAVGLLMNGSLGGISNSAYAASAILLDPTSTANVNAGVTPGPLSFTNGSATGATPVTLTNNDQSETYSLANTVSDNTGSGAGWNITVSTNQFANGSHTLSTTSTSVTSATISACQGGTCTLPTNGTTYPVIITSGSGAAQGTASKIFSAAANTGMGEVIITPTFSTTIPANAYAGTYSATFVISLNTGP